MRKSRFTTEQSVGILKEQEAGAMISELCRRHGISDNTFHRWKRKYGGCRFAYGERRLVKNAGGLRTQKTPPTIPSAVIGKRKEKSCGRPPRRSE